METTKISEINIYKVSIPDWKEKKEEVLKLVPESNFLQESISAYSDWHYTDQMRSRTGNHPYADKLFKEIDFEPHILFGGREGDYICTDLWCMRYSVVGDIHVHDHGTGMSGILYADYDPVHHPATTFISPVRNIWDGHKANYTPEVEEGDIILFPSQLLHYCKMNMSSISRVIFSFNLTRGT